MRTSHDWQSQEILHTMSDTECLDLVLEKRAQALAGAVLRQAVYDLKSNRQPKTKKGLSAERGSKHSARSFVFASVGQIAECRRWWCEAAGIDEKWYQKIVSEGIEYWKEQRANAQV